MVRIIRITSFITLLVIGPHMETEEIVALYQAGVDSFMEYPVNVEICAAQVESLIRLYLGVDKLSKQHSTLTFGSALIISPRYRRVLVEGKPIKLTRIEFDLLDYLARHQYQVFSAGQLYGQIWNDTFTRNGESTVIVHINTLRKKLGKMGHRVIETMRGLGYRFVPPSNS